MVDQSKASTSMGEGMRAVVEQAGNIRIMSRLIE